jgi:hypothetical protein
MYVASSGRVRESFGAAEEMRNNGASAGIFPHPRREMARRFRAMMMAD